MYTIQCNYFHNIVLSIGKKIEFGIKRTKIKETQFCEENQKNELVIKISVIFGKCFFLFLK